MYKINFNALVFILFVALDFESAKGENLTLPDGFLIGTATSAYQIEGAWNEDGKGENVWDHFVHKYPERMANKSTGDTACDFYHKYKEDIKLVKKFGFNHFRFSLSWARLLPTGFADNPNHLAIRYYHNIFDELEKHDIIPFVTIYHWDHPQIFEKFGGWLNESMAYAMADYAKFVYKEFGSRVKFITTLNEPYIYCNSGYGSTKYAPGANLKESGRYTCVHNILKAHALAYHIYDKEFRHKYNGKIGIALPCMKFYNKYDNDTRADDVAFEFYCGETANPIYSEKGDYPEIMKKLVAERSKLEGLSESKLPKFSAEWIERIRGSADYLGLNYYTSNITESLPMSEMANWPNDEGLHYSVNPKWISSQNPWLKVVPEGLRDILKQIKEKYNNPPVYILESGVSHESENDTFRINYFHYHMKEMLIAINEYKCNVKAFTSWSFLDSLEWNDGYRYPFGLIHVDFKDKNLKRTPKKSAEWFKAVIESRKILPPFA